MRRSICYILLYLLLASFQRPNDRAIVPDEKTAIKVAEAIWLSRFGKTIYKEEPFSAKLIGDSVWIVSSTPRHKREKSNFIAENPDGSSSINLRSYQYYIAEIRKSDCKVMVIERSR